MNMKPLWNFDKGNMAIYFKLNSCFTFNFIRAAIKLVISFIFKRAENLGNKVFLFGTLDLRHLSLDWQRFYLTQQVQYEFYVSVY